MSQIYGVSYDLRQPGRNYSALYDLLRSYPNWCRVTESYRLVQTTETAVQLRDKVAKVLDANDRIFVAITTGPAAWQGLPQDVSDWLHAQLSYAFSR